MGSIGLTRADPNMAEIGIKRRSTFDIVQWLGNPQSTPWRWLGTTSARLMLLNHRMTQFIIWKIR